MNPYPGVRFDYDAPGPFGFAESVEVANRRVNTRREVIRSITLSEVFNRVSFHLEDGHVVLDDIAALGDERVLASHRGLSASRCDFAPATDLMGFTVADLEAFWSAMRAYSHCCIHQYLATSAKGVAQEKCMPTQVLSRVRFVSAMAGMTGLDVQTIENMVERFTYDSRSVHPDIFLQPLVCGPEYVAWSSHVVLLSIQPRNVLKLMARTAAHKNVADNAIAARERPFLVGLGKLLATRGHMQFKVMVRLPSPSPGEIDLLAYGTRFPREVLVVEGKAILEADDLNEVISATKDMVTGQKQVSRSIEVLKSLTDSQKRDLYPFVDWQAVSEFYGLVLTPETEPTGHYCQDVVPGAALSTMLTRLTSREWRSPAR
jgi:hypothetical protein